MKLPLGSLANILYTYKKFDRQAAIADTKDFLQTTDEVVSQSF